MKLCFTNERGYYYPLTNFQAQMLQICFEEPAWELTAEPGVLPLPLQQLQMGRPAIIHATNNAE